MNKIVGMLSEIPSTPITLMAGEITTVNHVWLHCKYSQAMSMSLQSSGYPPVRNNYLVKSQESSDLIEVCVFESET